MTSWTEYVEDAGGYCAWCDEPLDRGTIVIWCDGERGHEHCEALQHELSADQAESAAAPA